MSESDVNKPDSACGKIDATGSARSQESMDGSPATISTPFIHIQFQCGVIPEKGVNGCTIREVIEVLEERLQGFQKGEFASRHNAIAITKLQEARMWLTERERDRKERGVEGEHAK